MSHFSVVVLVPSGTTDVEAAVGQLLAPYDENIEVAPHMTPCYCVGQAAQNAARQAAEKAVGDIDSFRDTFNALVEANLPDDIKALIMGNEQGRAELERVWAAREEVSKRLDWKGHIKPFTDAEAAALGKHKMKDKPNPKCEECSGSGQRETQYNPKSHWDWWVVGGRWQGWLVGYDPSKNPDNIVDCWLCAGTGTRTDELARGLVVAEGTAKLLAGDLPADDRAILKLVVPPKDPNDPLAFLSPRTPDYTALGEKLNQLSDATKNAIHDIMALAVGGRSCNGCGGTGKTVKHHHERPGYKGDIQLVSAVDWTEKTPFAVVTPDGQWNEKGEMGWFGMASNEKDKGVWKEQVLTLMRNHEDCLAVLVDCHI